MKIVFKFKPDQNGRTQDERILYNSLLDKKDLITQYNVNNTWDKYKKLSNDYEFIFTTYHQNASISKINPVSRSYFKQWEILHDFEHLFNFKWRDTPMKVGFLAEGPGGFIESFRAYRQCEDDKLYGVTLVDNINRNVPKWRVPPSANLKTLTGKDGTGSLYNMENIESFIEEIGCNDCDYVTGDGGMDFSVDFNKQEEHSLKLITCEVYTGLRLLKSGGHFVLKIFDIQLEGTRNLVAYLSACFDSLYAFKPNTSRPANSEKYIIGVGYNAH